MGEGIRRTLVTVIVAFVTASVAAGGTAFAIIANADKVDGYHANELTRMVRSSSAGPSLTGTSGTIRTAKINAPRNGFLFMVASSDVYDFGVSDDTSCWLALGGVELRSSERTIELNPQSSVNSEENCNTDAAWPVAAGVHTVTFVAGSVGADTVYDESTLEVMFVPFNGAGLPPKPVAPQVVPATVGN